MPVINDVMQQLHDVPIHCVKYNSSIGFMGQNFSHYEGQISIDHDGRKLCVSVSKPGANGVTKLHKSSASCKLSDIKGFVFGPFQSRFWMLRKHINSIPWFRMNAGHVPFYAWHCITI